MSCRGDLPLGVVTPPVGGCGPASEGLDGVPALAAECLPLAAFLPDDDPWPAYMATERLSDAVDARSSSVG